MKESDRRTSPRKGCAVPLRFRVVAEEKIEEPDTDELSGTRGAYVEPGRDEEGRPVESLRALAVAEGKALNLSERGIYFLSPEKLTVGQALEIYFTLPSELTGRGAEQVRCRAHVVHVDYGGNTRGIGARVEGFQPITAARSWSH